MPLRDTKCPRCNHCEELILPKEEGTCCPVCAVLGFEIKLERVWTAPVPARTPGLWGDSHFGGVNGHYDRGLKATYSNSQERDRIMREQGVMPASELGNPHWEQDDYEARVAEDKKWRDFTTKLDDAKAKYKDDPYADQRAICDVMPDHEVLAGKHDMTESA